MTQSSPLARYTLMLVATSLVIALFLAHEALAAPEASASQLASRYAAWAGSRDNARALVRGLTQGPSVTLVTHDRRGASAAGFTPSAMTVDEADAAIAQARSELARVGIARPNAEQIQAAFVGGEVHTASGRTRMLRGVAVPQEPHASPVASR